MSQICSRIKAPARASVARPSARRAFHNGHAWIICGQISKVTETSAAPAAAANSAASERSVSLDPTWINPQTVGELRGRAERLYVFDDLEAVESTLHRLAEMGFATELPRLAGSREPRYAHRLAGPVEASFAEAAAPSPEHAASLADRVTALEQKLDQMVREFEEFRKNFE